MITEPLPTLTEILRQHGVNARWTFSTFYRGVHATSPRQFDTIEDALCAVMEKLHAHALDREFPMISLIQIPGRSCE